MAHYKVTTRDVDGSGSRVFNTLAGAVKRFESMAGHTTDQAIAEHFYVREQRGERMPKIEELEYLRAVSMYGTTVVLEATSEESRAAAATARAAAAPVAA